MLPICRLCITVAKSPFNYCNYKTKHHWGSVDAHCQNVVVTVLLSVLPKKAANALDMHNRDQITAQLSYFQDRKSLTLCCRSLLVVAASSIWIFLIEAANTLIIGSSQPTTDGFCKFQEQKSLTLRWPSVLEWGNKCVSFVFTCQDGQYFHFWLMWLYRPFFAESVKLKIFDTPLRPTLMSY